MLNVEGMDCSSCALTITKNLQKKGLTNVYVNFATGEASFDLDDKQRLPDIIEGINNIGYRVVGRKDNELNGDTGLSFVEKKFYISLPFTIVLFFSHMVFGHDFMLNQPLVQLGLCIPVFMIGLFHFGKSAWGSLRAGAPNMDVLIAIGSTAAFIYSIAGTFLYWGSHEVHNYIFYETAATIITLVLLGNVIEQRSVRQTTTAIGELSKLQPAKARRIELRMGTEQAIETDVKDLRPGDLLLANTGDRIAADGQVISGNASADESMISGESVPVEKSEGDKVIGGTIVAAGSIRMRVERTGNDTVLSGIISLVKNAQQAKPSIQKLGDRVSNIFVPAVIGIALLTFLISYFVADLAAARALMNSIAVLVISCPCAMGLATPTAVMVGIGRAARSGILIRGGNTLEEFAGIKRMVFDKTGTLTTGEFKVSNISYLNGFEESIVLAAVLGLEQHSSHPLAHSLTRELRPRVVSPAQFTGITEEKGFGIRGTDERNRAWAAGSFRIADQLTGDRTHDVYVVCDGKLAATIDLEDSIRPGAVEAIASLKCMHIEPVLLSGDRSSKCEAVARKLGITSVYSEKLPGEKLELISKMVSEKPTGMTGDGINDAPALARASVGISLGDASQAAIQSAQVVLLKKNDLSQLVMALQISKHTLVTIKQNLFWAFFYNVLAIPVAAIGLLSPMIGSLSMALSDVIVIGNSIRLKTKRLTG